MINSSVVSLNFTLSYLFYIIGLFKHMTEIYLNFGFFNPIEFVEKFHEKISLLRAKHLYALYIRHKDTPCTYMGCGKTKQNIDPICLVQCICDTHRIILKVRRKYKNLPIHRKISNKFVDYMFVNVFCNRLPTFR